MKKTFFLFFATVSFFMVKAQDYIRSSNSDVEKTINDKKIETSRQLYRSDFKITDFEPGTYLDSSKSKLTSAQALNLLFFSNRIVPVFEKTKQGLNIIETSEGKAAVLLYKKPIFSNPYYLLSIYSNRKVIRKGKRLKIRQIIPLQNNLFLSSKKATSSENGFFYGMRSIMKHIIRFSLMFNEKNYFRN